MNNVQMAKQADELRKKTMNNLQALPFATVAKAGKAVNLPRFATKLHHYTGDVTTSMLVKVTKELSKKEYKNR